MKAGQLSFAVGLLFLTAGLLLIFPVLSSPALGGCCQFSSGCINTDFNQCSLSGGSFSPSQVCNNQTGLCTDPIPDTPSLTIDKAPKTQQVASGEQATFSITVTNTGNVGLASITVTDPLVPQCDRTFPTLAPGQPQTYTCAVLITESFTNSITATGVAPGGTTVSDEDTATVTVTDGATTADVAVGKGAVPFVGALGEPVEFILIVTNAGPDTAKNVILSDTLPQG